jgi:peroxiredoxin
MDGTPKTLMNELDRFRVHFERRVGPAVAALINSSKSELIPRENRVIAAGKPFPATSALLDTQGNVFDLGLHLKTHKTVIFFYRGSWCPYCKLTLRAFEDAHEMFKAAGQSLIAISPERPDFGAIAVERHNLTYAVLSDPGSKLIRAMGLDYAISENMRPLFEASGHSLVDRNGDTRWVLPLTSAFIVDPPGTIRSRFVSPDFTKRTELSAALAAIRS